MKMPRIFAVIACSAIRVALAAEWIAGSSEGFVLVQALRDGPLEIDFGSSSAVYDAFNGSFVCSGPKATLPFRLGETRLFRVGDRSPRQELRGATNW